MFVNSDLKNHLETKSSVSTKSAIFAEWNMNLPNNIEVIGNYRYRPLDGSSQQFGVIPSSFDTEDSGYFYTNATNADVVLDGTYDEDDTPVLLKTVKEKEKMLFSLESCFDRFRPRSGINKARYGINSKFLHYSNIDMASRPRYYMADKNDKFKYWSSFRSEAIYKYEDVDGSISYGPNPEFVKSDGTKIDAITSSSKERGISSQRSNNQNYIDDAVPFVVYKESIPANRIVIKMQTNVGTVKLNDVLTPLGSISDPFFGEENQTTPVKFRVQYLEGASWIDAMVFDEFATRQDGSRIIKEDGYLELSYGLVVPERFASNFKLVSTIGSVFLLPPVAEDGEGYLVVSNDSDVGSLYIWNNNGYQPPITPEYRWNVHDESASLYTNVVTELVNPKPFTRPGASEEYREFQYIRGLRVVAETMNRSGCSLDLIELSPRLTVDISNITKSYSIVKPASDIGTSGLPVGQLLAATGSLQIADYDQAFNENNFLSIISKYYNQHIQFKIYEVIENVNGVDYFVPIKTMYSDSFPKIDQVDRTVSIDLRDFLFYLESQAAPELLIPNASVSYAISTLLDYVGFSNYTFRRLPDEVDPVIPFFFVDPSLTLAEVLQQIALSTQTAMFFDEYNNFVMMTKGYMLPSESERPTDLVLYGSADSAKNGVYRNEAKRSELANIIDIAQQEQLVYNDGKISYNTRYIQKSVGTIKEAYVLDREKRWVYRPSLLWEATSENNSKSQNEETSTSSAYALTAIPLNSDLSEEIPKVVNHQIINNIIDLGEAVYWLGRYNGYFYSSGEVIRFDAVEYSIPGVANQVFIASIQEYQNYFSKIPFNGKMYPTGRVRIYSEPEYEEIDGNQSRLVNGNVLEHGRGQFGTQVTSHFAGINPYWTSPDNVKGVSMDSRFLFGPNDFEVPASPASVAGQTFFGADSSTKAKRSQRSGTIKNFLSSSYYYESEDLADKNPEMVQASALVFEGPAFSNEESPNNLLTYVTKKISNQEDVFKHFGTRMRVVGKVERDSTNWQSPSGSSTVYNISSDNPEDVANIDGGGGGLAVLLNPKTNAGYYFEILAMNNENLEAYKDSEEVRAARKAAGINIEDTETNIHNIFFYKIVKENTEEGLSVPIKLWSGLADILVDGGLFTGQERVYASPVQTVYDLAVEYENVGSARRFYLYLNGTQVATVDDRSPSPEDEHDNMALFVRGSSRCIFENVYALKNNYAKNSSLAIEPVASKVFSSNPLNKNESFNKYSLSGIIQSTFLSGISPSDVPQYGIFYDEFGTIMREAAYFNVKYDKAYPALYARIAPTPKSIFGLRGYTVSGFFAGAYGAEFLVFNATDTVIVLDETTGNYLKIHGIAFTQNSKHDLTVDEYFNKKSSLSNPEFLSDRTVRSPLAAKEEYNDIRASRMTYGNSSFSLDLDYIQSQDAAKELMAWMISKIMKPRRAMGVSIFANPTIQLGDIVEVDYEFSDVDNFISKKKRFVVYNIEYQKSSLGPDMNIFLSEVS